MDYLALRERPAQFQALTSLLPAEFDELLTDFAPAWERYHRWHTLDGAKRRLPAHQERANATLVGSDTKLFFLLTYLKSNSLQQYQAASFGVSQTRVSRLATALLDVLNQVLARRGLLPVRDGAALARRLADHPDPVFAYDGVERGVPIYSAPDASSLHMPTAASSASAWSAIRCACAAKRCATSSWSSPAGCTICASAARTEPISRPRLRNSPISSHKLY